MRALMPTQHFNRRQWSSDLYWRVSLVIMIGIVFAVIWFGPVFVIAARAHGTYAPLPSFGAIFKAASDALSEPRKRPVAALHRHPRPQVARAAPARPQPSQSAMAYAAEPKTVTGSGTIVWASWYGGGERLNTHTANGEVFRPFGLTCAHRTLAFGTRVRVTHVGNGRSVVCRVNDRGPHASTGKAIDLARGTATRIGMGPGRAGVARVRIEVLR